MPSAQSLRKPLHGGRALSVGALVSIILPLVVPTAEARFLEVHGHPGGDKVKKSLLSARRTKDPGYFDSLGPRGGVQREDLGSMDDEAGAKQDSSLGFNAWTSDSMKYNFPFLDNMQPVAPMDRVNNGDGVADLDPKYISKYQNPHMFPVVHGKGCMCQKPEKPGEKIECDCGKTSKDDHYTWLKDTPVLGTNNYTLEPADITYREGNYWDPEHRQGMVAPADALSTANYPNQAPGNKIFPLPAAALGDRIGVRFARYIDQVHDMASECDKVSPECVVNCSPGDKVVIIDGNFRADATVKQTYAGNALLVEMVPLAALNAPSTTECPLSAACSPFRFCLSAATSRCVIQQDRQKHNSLGNLITTAQCPRGSKVCQSVKAMYKGENLEKDGKACKAHV